MLSEAVNWRVMPDEWADVPLWWVEKILTYFKAKGDTSDELAARRATRQRRMMGS